MNDFAPTPKAVAKQPQAATMEQRKTLRDLENALREAKWKVQEADPTFRMRILQRDLNALRIGMRYCGHMSRMHEAFFSALAEIKREMHDTIELL